MYIIIKNTIDNLLQSKNKVFYPIITQCDRRGEIKEYTDKKSNMIIPYLVLDESRYKWIKTKLNG
jgi:hypothetical protein